MNKLAPSRRIAHLLTGLACLVSLDASARSHVQIPDPDAAPRPMPDEPWRAEPPRPGPVRAIQTPTPTLFQVAGIDVVLVERHELPVLTMELVLQGGAAWDPPGKEGLAAVCMSLLSSGTRQLDKVQFAQAQADLAASVDAWAGVDQQGLQLATLSRNLAPALDLATATLLDPGLRADELARIVARRKASLVQARGNPSAVAGRVAPAITFGPQQAWGRIVTEATLSAVAVSDCQAHTAALSPVGARLYVVGDVTVAKLKDELGRRLAAWKTPAPKLAAIAAPSPMVGRVFAVNVSGAEQSVVAVMAQGPERGAPDYEATSLMMGVLGAGFSSRINMNLREKHGWAYGAGGGYQYRRGGSLLNLQASVRQDATGPAIGEIFAEMAGIRAADVQPDELAREKQGAILSLPARWSTGRSVGATLQGLQYFGLPLDWYQGHVARLEAVDLAAVRKAATDHVNPAAAQVLIVGDLAKLGPQLTQLVADGPLKGQAIVRLDADAKPVAP